MATLKSIDGIRVAAGGEGTAIKLQMTDGSTQQIEIPRALFEPLLNTLFMACQKMGEAAPNPRSFPDTSPSDCVLIAGSDLGTRSQDAGGAWILMRLGSIDLAVDLANERFATAVAEGLCTRLA